MNRRKVRPPDPVRYANAFLTLADELHFGRAARRLGMGQPPLSQQIRRLEAALGFKLFVRHPRGVSLTAAGRVYADGMRRAVGLASRSAEDAAAAARGADAVLRVGFIATAAHNVLPRALSQLRMANPEIQIQLTPGITSVLMDGVRAGQLDAACVRGPIDAGELSAETIAREPLFAALPAGHVLARRSAVDLRRLSNECLVTFPPEHAAGLADLMCALWDKAGGRPPAQVVADEWVTIVNLVAAGIGVAVVPASVCTLRPAGIVYRPLADCDARAELWLVTRRDTGAAATRALLDACRSIGDAAGTCRKRAALP